MEEEEEVEEVDDDSGDDDADDDQDDESKSLIKKWSLFGDDEVTESEDEVIDTDEMQEELSNVESN